MLKKQHKKSSKDKMTERQQGRGMPGQSGNARDEVGHSGVYPQSGPHPDTPDAPLRNQGTWGQGQNVAQGAGEGLGGGQSGSERAQGNQGGQPRSPRAQPRGTNREEYEDNTEIKRETEFRDATGHPLDPDAGGPKVTKDDDLFGKERE
jgi:hypothetical protein